MTNDGDTDTRRDRAGHLALVWTLWGGILFAVLGESILFLLAGTGESTAAGLTAAHAAVSVGLTTLALGLVVAVRATSILGEGLPAALVCWMLFKSVAITGLVAHQLGGTLPQVAPFFGLFALGMAVLNPSTLERDVSAD